MFKSGDSVKLKDKHINYFSRGPSWMREVYNAKIMKVETSFSNMCYVFSDSFTNNSKTYILECGYLEEVHKTSNGKLLFDYVENKNHILFNGFKDWSKGHE